MNVLRLKEIVNSFAVPFDAMFKRKAGEQPADQEHWFDRTVSHFEQYLIEALGSTLK